MHFENKTNFPFTKSDIAPKIESYPDIATDKKFKNKKLLLLIGFNEPLKFAKNHSSNSNVDAFIGRLVI